MEFSKSVKDDEENKAKDVTDSPFSIEERNKSSDKAFENSVTDIDKYGQQSRTTNYFRDPYDSQVQKSAIDSSKCVAKELDQFPSSSNNKNLNDTDVYKKHLELPNLSASNLNTIDSRKSSTLSSVGFKKEKVAILPLNSMANDTKQFSFSLNSRFSSVIGNMSEIPCNKMKISSEKTQSSKFELRKCVRKSPIQVAILESHYLIDNYPGTHELERIATETKLDVSSVYPWFNRKRLKERGKERLKANNVVHLSEGEQSSDVQKVSTPIINYENNCQFQVNPRNTTELGNMTKGNSRICTVENVTAQQNTEKCDNSPKEGLKIDEYIAASSSTAEIVTTGENYLSHSPLREELCTDKECPLDLSMPKKSGNETSINLQKA